MEQNNDFESLLKGAAARFENEPLSETTVSDMIDARLVISKSKLLASYRKEMLICLICIGAFLIYIWSAKYFFNGPLLSKYLQLYIRICITGVVYCVASILLFVRLLQISFLQKAIGIRDYVTLLYKKTRWTLQVYLWISTIVGTGMLSVFPLATQRIPLYWMLGVILLAGVGFYYLNVWYLHKRFGKKIRELELLIAEFNEPDK